MTALHRFETGFDAANIDKVKAAVSASLAQAGIHDPLAYSVLTIVDEVCCNIFEHSQASWVEVELRSQPERLHLVVRDNGLAFDPTQQANLRRDAPPEEAAERKLGLYMMGKLSERCHYLRLGGLHNELSFEIKR